MRKTFILLVIALLVGGCIKMYHQPRVNLLMAYSFPSHNNYVDAYYNTDKFPDPRSYIKVGVIQEVSYSADMDKQITVMKSVAQQYGADGILILGINDPGISTTIKNNLGKDVLDIVSKKRDIDYYKNKIDNEMTVLAIKYRKNLDIVNQIVKYMKIYKYDTTKNKFNLIDIYKFSFDNKIISGDISNPDFKNIKLHSSSFLTYDKSPNWTENVREKGLIVREYNKFLSPKIISSTSLSTEGMIEKIIISYPRKNQKEIINYLYQGRKPLGRTIITKDSTILEEQYNTNKQNKVEEVLIYNSSKEKKQPLFKLMYSYYSSKDADSLIFVRKDK